MFSILVRGMLIVCMLAGVVGLLYGLYEIWGTVSFVSSSTGKTTGTFVGYHREIYKSTSIRSYSPANPNMPSTTESYSVATYPEFAYRTKHGDEQLVRESKVHVFAVYERGEEVEVLFSDHGQPRMGGFYSLYFRDLVISGIGALALVFALVFWHFALPLISKPHPAAVYSENGETDTSTVTVQDSTSTVEDAFNDIFKEALDYQVGPVKMRHILYGFLVLFVLVIILSFIFPAGKT